MTAIAHTHHRVVARVAGLEIPVAEIDARETQLRAGRMAAALPAPDTSEGRQLRRWLTQLIVTERVMTVEAARLGVTESAAPSPAEVLPDPAARHEVGSIAAAALARPLARALFAAVTADVAVGETEIADFHARNPQRFADLVPAPGGWQVPGPAPSLDRVRNRIAADLAGAARRARFRQWLDERRAALVELETGYEHPGDPRQPDNTHRH